MENQYVTPEMQFEEFKTEDVITTSSLPDVNDGGDD